MKNIYLIERKDGFFSKIKNFVKGLFRKEKKIIENYEEKEQINKELNKKQFMELYQKVKNREIDYETLDEDTVKKICELLKEELILRAKRIDEINSKKQSN